MNPNNLKIGDTIEIQQAWEDEQGNLHDEFPTITGINEDGSLELDTGNGELNIILNQAPYYAKDFKPE